MLTKFAPTASGKGLTKVVDTGKAISVPVGEGTLGRIFNVLGEPVDQKEAPEGDRWPRFDITFLGVGPDGHIASLFPDRPGIRETDASVIPRPSEACTCSCSAAGLARQSRSCVATRVRTRSVIRQSAGLAAIDAAKRRVCRRASQHHSVEWIT